MFKMLFLASALLGAASMAHAEPEVRRFPQKLASKDVASLGDDTKDVSHPGAAEDTTRTLRVGDVDVVIPLLRGYRDLNGLPEVYRGFFERVVPPVLQLLDFHQHEGADGVSIHDLAGYIHYEITAVKASDAGVMSPKEWNDTRSSVLSALKTIDLQQMMKSNAARISDAFDEYGVDMMTVDAMQADVPQVYSSDEKSIRLLTTVKNQQTIEGKVYHFEEVRASAMVYVRGKMITIVAAKEFRAGSATPKPVVEALNLFADRMIELNP